MLLLATLDPAGRTGHVTNGLDGGALEGVVLAGGLAIKINLDQELSRESQISLDELGLSGRVRHDDCKLE